MFSAILTQWWCLLIVVLGGHACFSQCLSVEEIESSISPSKSVDLTWAQPACNPPSVNSTVASYAGALAGGFFVSHDPAEQLVALPLGTLAAGSQITEVRAYVLGANNATPQEWGLRADMWVSLHCDSSGYPGSPVDLGHHWPISDSAELIGGGWFLDNAGWGVDALEPGTFWLVLRWLEGASDVVWVGRDATTAPTPYWVGLWEDIKSHWQKLTGHGLLIEVEIISPTQPDSNVTGQTLTVIRGFPHDDKNPVAIGTVGLCEDGFSDDLAPSEETLRYGLVTYCDTIDPETVWADPLSTPPAFDISIHPPGIWSPINYGEVDSVPLSITNGESESLRVTVSVAEFDTTTAEPRLRPEWQTALIPPRATMILSVVLDATGADPGFYTGGMIKFAFTDQAVRRLRTLTLPVELLVDQHTAIGGTGGEGPFAGDGRDQWEIRPMENPFTDQISLRLQASGALTGPGTGSSFGIERGRAPALKVSVYDILGRLVESAEVTPTGLAAGDGSETIRIFQTTHWPSGVYICRVSSGGWAQSVKLVHLR